VDSDRRTIILVDDSPDNLTQGKNLLNTFYRIYPAPSAAKLFETLEHLVPDLILLDIEMPEMNGYEVIRKLKGDTRFADIPVIFLTSKDDEASELEGFNLGAADYVYKPFSPPRLLKRIAKELLIARQKKDLRGITISLKREVDQKTAEVIDLQNTVLATVTGLVEFRDKLTGGHIERTQRYMEAMLQRMVDEGTYRDEIAGWNKDFFLPSVPLHDVGKIAISDLILNKPGALTPEEFEIMKTHVTIGVDAIEGILNSAKEHAFLRHALYIVGMHHEKWDGTGYPVGLKGMDIPLEGRLMAIADVYDALISERPYKKAMPHDEAMKIITDGAGKSFDPVLVDIFRKVKDEFACVAQEHGA